MQLRRVTLREYVAGLDDARGERLQTREFVAQSEVTIRKVDDAIWVSGARRTIVVPWSAVLQCEPVAGEAEAESEVAAQDTDAAQVAAYGAGSVAEGLSSVGGSMLPLEPSTEPATVAEYAAAPDTSAPASDAFEVLSDAVGKPMRRVVEEIQAAHTDMEKAIASSPKLTRKERRRSRR